MSLYLVQQYEDTDTPEFKPLFICNTKKEAISQSKKYIKKMDEYKDLAYIEESLIGDGLMIREDHHDYHVDLPENVVGTYLMFQGNAIERIAIYKVKYFK